MKNDTDSVNRFSVFPCRIILSSAIALLSYCHEV